MGRVQGGARAAFAMPNQSLPRIKKFYLLPRKKHKEVYHDV